VRVCPHSVSVLIVLGCSAVQGNDRTAERHPCAKSLFKQVTIIGLQDCPLCVSGKRQRRRESLGTEAVERNGETGPNGRLEEASCARRHTLSTSSREKRTDKISTKRML